MKSRNEVKGRSQGRKSRNEVKEGRKSRNEGNQGMKSRKSSKEMKE